MLIGNQRGLQSQDIILKWDHIMLKNLPGTRNRLNILCGSEIHVSCLRRTLINYGNKYYKCYFSQKHQTCLKQTYMYIMMSGICSGEPLVPFAMILLSYN